MSFLKGRRCEVAATRIILRPGSAARRRGSVDAGFGATLRRAREQRRAATAAIHDRRSDPGLTFRQPKSRRVFGSVAGSGVPDFGNAGQRSATGNELRGRKSQRAGLLENGNVARISRRLVDRGLRSLRARSLGWKFRWARESRVCRTHGRRAAVVSNHRQLARELAGAEEAASSAAGREFEAGRILRGLRRFAGTHIARSASKAGSFPEFRRSKPAMCIAKSWSTKRPGYAFQSMTAPAN